MRRALSTAALLLFASNVASATVLLDWSPEDVIERADLIVVGTVQSQRYVEIDGELMTESEIAVERALYGTTEARLTLSQIGGKKGHIEADVIGDARLVPGDRVLLLTYAHPDGRRYLVGMALGAYRLTEDRDAADQVEQTLDVAMVNRDGRIRHVDETRRTTIGSIERMIQKVKRP